MKPSAMLTLGLALATALSACSASKKMNKNAEGVPVTTSFLKTYSGTFGDAAQGEEIQISPDGRIRMKQIRQVGSEKGPVPLNTTCTYFEDGVITDVFKRTAARRAGYMDYAETLIKITVTKVTLDGTPGAKQDTPENCAKFAATGKRIGNYSLYAELLDGNKFRLHTSGGGNYKNKGTRTESTMDEVFDRSK